MNASNFDSSFMEIKMRSESGKKNDTSFFPHDQVKITIQALVFSSLHVLLS